LTDLLKNKQTALWIISKKAFFFHFLSSALWRQWELCSTEPEPPDVTTAFDFTVMSYNILSQDLLQDNAYLYRHCDPGVLSWDHRLPNLLAEIQQHNADVSGIKV